MMQEGLAREQQKWLLWEENWGGSQGWEAGETGAVPSQVRSATLRTWQEGQGRSGDQPTPQCSVDKSAVIEQIRDQAQSWARTQLPQVRMSLQKGQGQRPEFNAAPRQDGMGECRQGFYSSFDGSIFQGLTAAPCQTKAQREERLQGLLMQVEPWQLWGTVSLT